MLCIPTWAIIMAISGIETVMQLGSLGEANFKAAKYLTSLEELHQTGGIAQDSQDSQECCCFLGEYS